MPNSVRFALLLFLLGAASGTGCAPGDTNGTALGDDDDGGSSGSSGSSGFGNTAGMAGMVPISTINCGDGTLNMGEYCDDHNLAGGDGCSPSCQIEAGWTCPTAGAPCVRNSACGDAMLGPTEQCDDGNTMAGDGCAADCSMVEPGFQCRVPGKRCVPFCGDGQMVGGENCDDMNMMTGDGCSSTCLVEPGWSCMGTPSTCRAAMCGNGMEEAGESCDRGADNGLFTGDGSGCSKTCTQEPTCRTGAMTHACSTACGDANIDMGETCDDGNAVSGDGCSATCMTEGGFTCTNMDLPDTQPCPSNPALQCLVLPVIYRDFEGQHVSGGHPDFFYLGATASGGRTTGVTPGATKTTCAPNAGGTPLAWMPGDPCRNTDAVGPCTGLVGATLDAMGKPTLARNTCPCIFTDWERTGILSGVMGVQQCWVENEGSMRDRIQATVSVIQDAASFGQWFARSNAGVRGTLELAQTGMQYQFSSSVPGAMAGAMGRTVRDDIHANCLMTATPLQSGFFPLEMAAGAKLCNIWPYWKYGAVTTEEACRAGAGFPQLSEWDPLAAYDNCPTAGTGGPVPRSNGMGAAIQGVRRNFYFTTEARYLFRYTADATLSFYGDDDVWVFVNGRLALDLGAPHERLQGMVAINATFGLEVGKIYEIVVFHADRHPRESNYQLTLSGFSTQKTSCIPTCGDGVVTAAEECDEGPMNMDGVYGGCTTMCKFGPFCGDGVPDVGSEECDQGRANGAGYGMANGCTSGCRFPPRCGDGIVNGEYGEACDAGSANSDMGECRPNCTLPDR